MEYRISGNKDHYLNLEKFEQLLEKCLYKKSLEEVFEEVFRLAPYNVRTLIGKECLQIYQQQDEPISNHVDQNQYINNSQLFSNSEQQQRADDTGQNIIGPQIEQTQDHQMQRRAYQQGQYKKRIVQNYTQDTQNNHNNYLLNQYNQNVDQLKYSQQHPPMYGGYHQNTYQQNSSYQQQDSSQQDSQNSLRMNSHSQGNNQQVQQQQSQNNMLQDLMSEYSDEQYDNQQSLWQKSQNDNLNSQQRIQNQQIENKDNENNESIDQEYSMFMDSINSLEQQNSSANLSIDQEQSYPSESTPQNMGNLKKPKSLPIEFAFQPTEINSWQPHSYNDFPQDPQTVYNNHQAYYQNPNQYGTPDNFAYNAGNIDHTQGVYYNNYYNYSTEYNDQYANGDSQQVVLEDSIKGYPEWSKVMYIPTQQVYFWNRNTQQSAWDIDSNINNESQNHVSNIYSSQGQTQKQPQDLGQNLVQPQGQTQAQDLYQAQNKEEASIQENLQQLQDQQQQQNQGWQQIQQQDLQDTQRTPKNVDGEPPTKIQYQAQPPAYKESNAQPNNQGIGSQHTNILSEEQQQANQIQLKDQNQEQLNDQNQTQNFQIINQDTQQKQSNQQDISQIAQSVSPQTGKENNAILQQENNENQVKNHTQKAIQQGSNSKANGQKRQESIFPEDNDEYNYTDVN